MAPLLSILRSIHRFSFFHSVCSLFFFFFFFNDTATTEIYTLSLHDALPILRLRKAADAVGALLLVDMAHFSGLVAGGAQDRKSTRLNSSHMSISYAVFCLKKKKKTTHISLMTMTQC